MEDNSKLTSYLIESIEGIEVVKSFNGEKEVAFQAEKRFINFIKLQPDIQSAIVAAKRLGEKVAFVGESGSGKTTIAKLLMNFYDINKGAILLDSYNIRDIRKDVIRNKISYISQEFFFFSGTILENLKFANKDASYEDVISACKKAQIHEYINSLPLRYETLLVEKGINFSGGQRQRLSIARAILAKPDILIMDEATSNLDSITEMAIEKTLGEFTKDITTIVIAHRLSTIKKCDRIYAIENGKIAEEGNHNNLIMNNKNYYKLYSQQCNN